MSTRSTLPFLVVVFVVALAGTFLALTIFNSRPSKPNETTVVTVPVYITTTPDPNVTPQVIIITATFDTARTQIAVPETIIAGAETQPALVSTRPTLDVAGAQELNPDVAQTATALPQNCLLHTIVEGDSPFGIAEQYGANGFVLLAANGLTEETATGLQIGDTIIVPLEGCPVESLASYAAIQVEGEATFTPTPRVSPTPTGEATEEATAAQSPTPKASPTITLAPTAASAKLQISGLESPGDVTAEGVVIRNTGNTVTLTGWTLSDSEGNVYTFNEANFFSNALLRVYTRDGSDTALVRFWGLDRPVWNAGDVVTLKDPAGQVIATGRVDELPVVQPTN